MAVTAESPIFGPPSISEKRFVNHLRAAKSPAADEGASIYRRMVNNGFDPLIALGQFQAESGLGTKGHAVSTRNWGNILFYEWTKALGAADFAPGNGFHYSEFPTWTQGARAYIRLMKRYEARDFDTVEKMAAHWLGDKVGTPRTQRYVDNILQACPLRGSAGEVECVDERSETTGSPDRAQSPTGDVRRQVRRHDVGDRQARARFVNTVAGDLQDPGQSQADRPQPGSDPTGSAARHADEEAPTTSLACRAAAVASPAAAPAGSPPVSPSVVVAGSASSSSRSWPSPSPLSLPSESSSASGGS